MPLDTTLALMILKAATVAFGLGFLYFAIRGVSRHRTRALVAVLAAVSLLTLAAILEGVAVQGLGMAATEARIIEAVFTLLGFAVLFYSVIAARVGRRRHLVIDVEPADG